MRIWKWRTFVAAVCIAATALAGFTIAAGAQGDAYWGNNSICKVFPCTENSAEVVVTPSEPAVQGEMVNGDKSTSDADTFAVIDTDTYIDTNDIHVPSIFIPNARGYTGFLLNKDGSMYYRDGELVKDCFVYAAGNMYHIGESGYLDTGWYLSSSGEWFYFDGDAGGKSVEGWICDDSNSNGNDSDPDNCQYDTWYYLEDGKYKTGWNLLLDSSGENWYYFDESTGAMLSNCRTPDGYYVDENGRWAEDEAAAYAGEGFTWNKPTDGEPGQISGLMIAGMPAEFYMLSIAGETSGMSNGQAIVNGDSGRAYGVCQFDYRFDLVAFMQYAYKKHPKLWPGFQGLLSYADGDENLRGNRLIAQTFLDAMEADYETAINDQLEFVRLRYWDKFAAQMDAGGFSLSERHIAVSAALLSINVNCGSQAGIFLKYLSPKMSDEEMIREIYRLRNTVFADQYVGNVKKGTTARYQRCEPQMALDLLYGYTTIDSNVRYGGGVEWHGNPFMDAVTTAELPEGFAGWEDGYTETEIIATQSDASQPDS